MKKRKKEILHNKEQSIEQSTVQSSVQSTVQSTEQSSVQSIEQPSVQSNGAYVYGVGMLPVFAVGVCVFFAYNTSQAKNNKKANEKKDQPPKRCHML